jgi:hypothetical protein
MDETGLFWRMTPSRGLSSQARLKIKKDKTRITIVVCTNVIRLDQFRPWFISKAKVPRALRNVNIQQWEESGDGIRRHG